MQINAELDGATTLSITTFSLTTLNMIYLIVILSIKDILRKH